MIQQLITKASRETITICMVLFHLNRSCKHQNTISLKTGVSNKVYVMQYLHYKSMFLQGKVLSSGTC